MWKYYEVFPSRACWLPDWWHHPMIQFQKNTTVWLHFNRNVLLGNCDRRCYSCRSHWTLIHSPKVAYYSFTMPFAYPQLGFSTYRAYQPLAYGIVRIITMTRCILIRSKVSSLKGQLVPLLPTHLQAYYLSIWYLQDHLSDNGTTSVDIYTPQLLSNLLPSHQKPTPCPFLVQ